MGSRNRGRQTSGGRLALRFVEDPGMAPVLLEEWEAQRLRRLLPRELALAVRPSPDPRDVEKAGVIADVLGEGHPMTVFFRAATLRGGFTVGRA